MPSKKTKKVVSVYIDEDSIFSRNEEQFLISELDNETVFMDVDNGTYFGLNSTSTNIWKIIEKPQKFSFIIQELLELYEIDKESCQKETVNLLLQLLKKKMIHLKNEEKK